MRVLPSRLTKIRPKTESHFIDVIAREQDISLHSNLIAMAEIKKELSAIWPEAKIRRPLKQSTAATTAAAIT